MMMMMMKMIVTLLTTMVAMRRICFGTSSLYILSKVNQWWSELSQLDISTFKRIVNAPLIICIAMHFPSTPFAKSIVLQMHAQN